MKQNETHKTMKMKTNFTLSFSPLKRESALKKQENRFEAIRSTERNAVATYKPVCLFVIWNQCYKLIECLFNSISRRKINY